MEFNLTRESKVIAFDPGLTGGMCFRSATSIGAGPMPIVKKIVNKKVQVNLNIELITAYLEINKPDLVGIELVHSMPKQGVASTFKFGVGYGILQGICGALRIPIIFVTPQEWKKEMVGYYLDLIKDEYNQYINEVIQDYNLSGTEVMELIKAYKNHYKNLKKASSIMYVKSREYPVNLYATINTKVKSDGIADAICIADYIFRKYIKNN